MDFLEQNKGFSERQSCVYYRDLQLKKYEFR
jgi:hypothetical protein